tara:strand:- start:2183 stop:2479 length:297 start_codon:yes stop_codon:yes gene_type:complete
MGDTFFRKSMAMGLGEAIQRHNTLHKAITSGIASPDMRSEYKLITDALNNIKLDLGFDCDEDGIPDTIEVFSKTAKTSCCRLIPTKSGRRKTKGSRRK